MLIKSTQPLNQKRLYKKDIEDIFPLIPMQEGMLFHYLKNPGSDLYFEQLSLEIAGEIDFELFEKAWNFVIETNEMLRAAFRWEKIENPLQIILKKHQLQPKYYDLSGEKSSEKKTRVENIKDEDRKEKFDLREVPFKVSLCKVEENKYEMIISNHHILYDGWSNGIILKELFEIYNALWRRDQWTRPSFKPSYKDFIQWIQSQDKAKQKQFWQKYLAGFEYTTGLPIKIKRKKTEELENSAYYPMLLEKSIKDQLEIFIKEHRVTMATFFYISWGILLQRYCNNEDVIFGITVSGRSAPIKGIQNMVGLFINTIPLRIKLYIDEKVMDLLYRVNDSLLIQEKYGSTPLVDIKEYSGLGPNEVLFDSIISLENYPIDHGLMGKSSQLPLVVDSYSIVESSNYELSISITIGEMIGINFIYNPTALEEASVLRLSSHFSNIIENILYNPNKGISGIEILSTEEKKQVLYDFNNTEAAYPQNKTIHQLFTKQASRTPDNIAVVTHQLHENLESTRELAPLSLTMSITYKELERKSNQLAHLLKKKKKGVGPDTIMGIMMERSLKMIVGILAVLKAGGAFLPIDTDYPVERKTFMLHDSNTHILLTCSPLIEENNFKFSGEIILLDELSVPDGVEMNKDIASTHVNTAYDLAYIMYTSGSTGRPKGVVVEHRNVVRLVVNTNYIRLTGETRILQTGAPVFDATTFEIWGALLNGGQLVLVEKEVILDAHRLGQVLHQNKINTLWLTSPLFNQVARENCEIFSNLDYLLVGGDVLSPPFINLVRSKSEKLKIINGYGPTENTTFSTTFLIDKDFEEAIPIGSPIANSTAFVLGTHGELQPVGVFGELWVGGDGVSRGYLNHPEMTREKFVNLPSLGGMRLYRTGDITRWMPDGNIQFSRRIDSQVKIRGFRVEPVEIEKYLLEKQEVKEALVIVREEETVEKYLCAYITPDFSGISPTTDSSTAGLISRLQEFLSCHLPGYMVPAQFVMLEKIPLNPNGKVDIKALPKPEIKRKQAVVAPRYRVEKQLRELWAMVLGMEKERISIDDDFFQLGGHSLKATTLVSRIHKVIHIKLPLMEIFNRRTIRRLSQYIKEADEEHYSSIEAIEEKDYYLLSPAQKRLYFLHRLDETTSAYNISCAWFLEGLLDKDKWEHVFRRLIQRHESLRTSFLIIDEEPVQRIHKYFDFEIEYIDSKIAQVKVMEKKGTSGLPPLSEETAARSSQLVSSTVNNFIRPFELSKAPLIRVGLLEIEKNKHIFMVDMHHIVSDGTSAAVLVNEFMSLYDGEEFPPLRLRYKDFSQWQRSKRQKALIERQGEYWLEKFVGDIPVLDLPYDFSRPLIQSFSGSSLEFKIGEEETKKLTQLAFAEGSTLFMVLLALFNIFLGKVSGQEDIVVGSPAAGRKQSGLEQIIGIFINTLALRNYPTAEKSITAFLRDVKENTLKAQENQDYPFEELVELVEVNRDTSRNPLFDVMLVFQNMEQHKLQVPGLALTPYPYESKKSKFDMTLTVVEHEGNLSFTFTYNRDLFKKTTIQRFIEFFKRIAAVSLENPLREIAEIEIIPDDEKKQVLYDFNATSREYPTGRSIHLWFEEQVPETADHIAVVGNPETPETQEKQKRGTAPIQITYKELNTRANQLGRLLRAKGVIPDSITGIMTGPSLEMIIGIMAILKAGGGYLPIDSLQPQERITYMLNDSQASVLLTSHQFTESLHSDDHSGQQRVYLDEACVYTGDGTNLETTSKCQDVLYTIYTSGTTGKSKGTLVENKNLVNYIQWFKQKVHLIENDRTVLTSSFGFDLGYTNIYSSILSGCQLHLVPREVYLSPEYLLGYMIRHRITFIKVTPSLFSTIVGSSIFSREACQNLRLVLLGGEEIRLKDVEKTHGIGVHMEIMNHYGPTEATIGCVARFIDFNRFDQYKIHPTIGSPIDNMKAVILDNGLMLVPVGVAGELCVSGAGVARGYLNQPELTAQKFLPYSHQLYRSYRSSKSYIYRTGDKARWLTSGMIEFLGRIDHQVKIRGYRIETGEIQSQLLKHKAIKEVVVIPFEHSSGDKYLCAYIVWNRDEEVYLAAPQPELKGFLADRLPEYMIPTYFVTVDRIPLTPNGKLNGKLLPKPEIKIETRYVAPRDAVEEKLLDIWGDVLFPGGQPPAIGIDDHFFHWGGHSLTAIILISRIHKVFHVNVPLAEIFKTPTARGLSAYIKSREKARISSIEPVEKKDYYSLSSAQKRLYILRQMDETSTGYNMPSIMVLEGEIDKTKLQNVFSKLIKRHESLRTSFIIIDDKPIQRIHEDVQFNIEYHLAERKAQSAEQKMQSEKRNEERCASYTMRHEPGAMRYASTIKDFIRPFDLSQAPLMRVGLIQLEEETYLLMVDMHHIISDGISRRLLIQEFMAFIAGEFLPALRLQYRDFSQWQNIETQKKTLISQESYWKRQFHGEIPVLDLPTDYARPAIQRFEGSRVIFELDPEETSALKSLALERNVTLYMVLLAIYYILLSKLTNQEDIMIGTPTAGRGHADLEPIIGMFVNTLVLRNYPLGEKAYIEFLNEVKERSLQAFENQAYQYENLVEEAAVHRDASRNPLFDTMFVMQNMGIPQLEIPGLKLRPYEHPIEISKFDLTLIGVEIDEKLVLIVEYSTNLFKRATIERFITYLKTITSVVLENPDIKICETDILSKKEKRRLLVDFNDTETDYPKDMFLHQLFENQVEQTPAHTALVGKEEGWKGKRVEGKREEESFGLGHLSYRELNEKSDHLALQLREKGIRPDTIVGIKIERSIEMIIGLLGILKAGGAYLPIDPDYPEERISYLLNDSGVNIMLTEKEITRWLSPAPIPPSTLLPFHPSSPANLAYTIYTSGSTGKPKGVMIGHRSLVNVLLSLQKQFPLEKSDAYLLKTSVTFDVSAAELFGWFFNGGRLVLLGRGDEKNPGKILDTIARLNITHINFVPSMFNAFLNILNPGNIRQLSSLKYIFLAGEALLPNSVNKFMNLNSDVLLENIYGPTEGTIYASWYSLSGWDEKCSIPIGKPLPNIRLYVLDKYRYLQPVGITGELCISGTGLARGYLNRPELTAEKFDQDLWDHQDYHDAEKKLPVKNDSQSCSHSSIPSPHHPNTPIPHSPHSLIYRTGDLARWLSDGSIEFLGRIDHQVKVRGFRIELGEIENHLLRHEKIKDTVVIAKEEKGGSKYLEAYFVPISRIEISLPGLRDYLLKLLPEYMVPTYFIQVDKIPLTSSGKVDRRGLPIPGITPTAGYLAPRDEIELKLADIWREVLSHASIGIDHNFFLLGGHSLKATVLETKICKAFNIRLPLQEIFKRPTIRSLAQYIKEAVKEQYLSIEAAEKKDYYVLSSAQKRLYFLHQMDEKATTYNMPSAWVLQGAIEKDKLGNTIRQLLQRHESLRTSFIMVKEESVQLIHNEVEFEIEYYELQVTGGGDRCRWSSILEGSRGLAPLPIEPATRNSQPATALISSFIRPFDLSQAPLLRVGLIKLLHTPTALRGHPRRGTYTSQEGKEEKYLLMIDIHHIIADGMSLEVLVQEFMALYPGKRLTGLRLQYKDYAQWQQREKKKTQIIEQQQYWLKEFVGEIPVLELPYDYRRPSIQQYEGSSLNFQIDKECVDSLKSLALEQGTTLYMVLLAPYTILLSVLSSQEDIIIGTPVAGRKHADLENIIGMFVNTLAVRNYPTGEKTFTEFLAEVKAKTLEAQENQEYPFEELVEKLTLHIDRDTSRNPLFDVIFSLQNSDIWELEIPGLKLKPYDYKNNISKFDLTFVGTEKDEGLFFTVEYCIKLFKKQTIERFVGFYQEILHSILENPLEKIGEIEIISPGEKRLILNDFNDTASDYPADKTIHELFAGQIEKWWSKISVKCDEKHLSYGGLNNRANGLARILRKKGVKTEAIVGIMVKPSPEMISAILAILKAGGAYLPIDPDYPKERVQTMLQDCGVTTLITEANLAAIEVLQQECRENLRNINRPADLAYIIFTSGSTGKPKGVMIDHRNIVRLMFNDKFLFDFNSSDVWTLFHSCCFDFSVWEMYGALLYGGKLVVIPKMVARDSEKFLEILKKEKVTVLNQVPSAFYNLSILEEKYSERELNLKYIIFGGEALKPIKLKELKSKYPGTKFINMYGITETTVHVTYKEIGDKEIDLNLCNIGRPIPTLTLYIVDKNLKLQPMGVPGELLVGGEGVGRGYLNRLSLTGEKFIHNPYQPGRRLYKSGDLAKWTDKGEIEYLGRIDHQVKVRGFRIELGEIENQLLNFAPVKEAVVLDREDTPGDKQLVAYIVPDPQYAYPVQQLLQLKNKGLAAERQLHELPNGMILFYLNRNETDFMYQEIFAEQCYLQEGIRLNDEACIFDIGANIGVFSLFVHQLCKNARIYSFEPIPPVYQLLELNATLYGMDVKLFQCGISSQEREAIFTYYPHNTVLSGAFADTAQEMETVKAFINNQQLMNKGKANDNVSGDQVRELLEDRLSSLQFKCRLKTLSQIIKENRVEKIDLLKIDVEKSEMDVLAGIHDEDWWRIQQLVIEVHDIDGRLDKIIELLEYHGYHVSVKQDRALKNTHLHNLYAVRWEENEISTSSGSSASLDTRGNPMNLCSSPNRLKVDARSFLKEKVPEYMIPSVFVLLETIPLTPNNKIDRKSLPGIENTIKGQYIGPQNEVEEILARIWSEVLGIATESVSTETSFFDLGGHSLKATLLAAKIHKILNIKIPLTMLFTHPTIKKISQYIKTAETADRDRFVSIEASEGKDYYRLSSAQKRLYVLHQLDMGGTGYNIPEVVLLEGTLDRVRVEEAFRKLIARHESLRTSFEITAEEAVQRIHDEVELAISYRSLVTGEEESIETIIEDFVRPFDLSKVPLLRVGLIHTLSFGYPQHGPYHSQAGKPGDKYILMVDMHHIVSDGTSMNVLIKEFMGLYAGVKLLPLRIQYKDFSEWQNSNKERELVRRHEAYWLKEFEMGIPILNLPVDFVRPVIQSFEGSSLKFEIGERETQQLKKLALVEGLTLYMVLLAVYNILLSRLSGQEEIVVGTSVTGRSHTDLEQMIGVFINTLPLKNNPLGTKSFKEFIKEIKENTLHAFTNQDYPYEDMVEQLEVERDAGRNPLFDVMFVFQNFDINQLKIPGLKLTPYRYETKTSKFDMLLAGMEENHRISLSLEYSTNLFEKTTIHRFINYFKTIVLSVLEDSSRKLGEIDILPEEEKRKILYDFNDTTAADSWENPVHEMFAQQALRTPHKTAVVGAVSGTGRTFLTFQSLNENTNRLGRLLQKRGIKSDIPVGIMMERSLDILTGMLAILKAGGTYLPIDPQYPANRIALLANTSGMKLLLSLGQIIEKKLIAFASFSYETNILLVDEIGTVLQQQSPEKLKSISKPGDLIYIIFTSGSTGIPKGAGVYHRGFTNLVHWFVTEFALDNRDRNLLLTSLSFDLTQKNLYTSLVTGGRLCIPEKNYFEPHTLLSLIRKEGITWINCTPGMFYKLVEYETHSESKQLTTLRYVFLGGEPIAVNLLIPWLESDACRAQIVNTYGPTECTDICASYRLQQPRRFLQEVIPVGKPVYNVQLYIVDKHLRLVPVGVTGELLIEGAGLGTGYLNDTTLTSEKFIPHTFEPNQSKQLLYRTGDLVKWRPDGNIEFVGRMDHQVKVRGFRVEIGEIENQLLSHQQVKETVVMALERQNRDRYICAYIVPHQINGIRENEIKNYLAEKLPLYMIPSYFMFLERLPLNPHGKVDRKALPQPAIKPGIDKDYVPPGNQLETILVGLWSEVLNLDKSTIGVHDNFFHSGGHSLKAVGLLNRIYKEFSLQVPLGELFKTPYIRDIAGYIQRSGSTFHTDIESVEKKEYYPLSSAQKRLYLLQQMELESTAYNMPRVLPLSAGADIKRLTAVFRELIRRHESLRTSFHMIHDEPVQKIHDHVEFKIECIEFQVTCGSDRCRWRETHFEQVNACGGGEGELATGHQQPEAAPISSFILPFDLSRVPLLRVGLIEAGKGKQLLLVDTHHIIMDGTSTDIFKREFITLYEEEKLVPLRLQYKDFAKWQTSEKQKESIKQQEVFWLKMFPFSGEVPMLNLPIDSPRPIMQSFAGSSVDFVLSRENTRALNGMAQEIGGTLYMVILALYSVLLSKLSGQEDIIVGTPIAARRYVDLENIIGMFANSIAMRNYPSAEKSFTEFLMEVKQRTLAAYEKQEYQFEELVEKVALQRDTSRNPIFDVMFNLMDSADYTDKFTQIIEQNRDENQYCYEQVTAKFDLNLTAVELGGKLHFNIEYCTRLFKAETIHRFIRYFKNLAALLSESENIEMKLADLDILTGKEKKEILEISTGIEQSYDREITQTVQRWFEEQVEKNPDAIAVIGHSAGCRPQGVNDRSTRCSLHHALTYRELNRRANQLAGFLRKKGVKPDTVVVIMMERSIEMIAAILSILKAGGAYIPIDAQYPDVRKQYMLEDSGPKLLLINYNIRHKQASVFIPNEIPVIDIRDEQIYHCDERNPEHIFAKSGSNLLYVIYTSGSTGKPKGVMMEHINLVNLIRYQIKYTNIDCSRVLQFTTISFDVSFQEIFSTLLGGGQLFLIDEETQRDIPLLFRFIENNQVKTLFLPASFLKFVLNEKEYQGLIPGCIDHIASAGEQLVVGNSLRKYLQQHQVFLHNHYGPAEAHVVTTLTLDPNDEIPVHPSIGRPISNCRIYILDNRHHLQPIGVSGQLVIGGIPVGRGYLNRPEITAEKFCLRRSGGRRMAHGAWCSALCALRASPRNSVPLQIPGKGIHSYMSSESYTYQTGDLGRWLSDGNIEFLGRLDTQVKIRGFRIELGEIENYLRNHADIKDAVVVAKEASNETREQYLCAYVVTNKESQVPELREYLSRNVPDYMIPSYFVPLEQIPLNPNRKVDKEALPEPDLRINANDTYAQPRDPVQKRMVNLWSEVLGIKTGVMGIDDNFFQLGGHSLKAAVLTSKLHKEFQVKVPLAEVFQNPTIRGLSKRIKRMKPGEYTSIPPGEEKEFYPASYNQKRLWLLNQESPQLSTFNMAGIITLDHDVDIHLVKKVLNRIIRRHDSFKTGFKVISDQLVQVIKKEMEIHFEMKDLSSITPPAKENKKQEIYSRELEAPFDLQQMPLFRAALLKLSEGKYELLFNMHHIISDGWSIEILKQEFKTLYDAYKKGIPCDIDMQPLEIQYKDYTVWQNQLLSDEEKMAEAKESWKAYLSGTLSVLNLPYDFTHYSNSTASSAYRCVVPESLTNQLRKMAAESHASLFMILLAGINILLSQVTGQEEIILAIPAAARQHEALKNILGFFVNTLILRSKINSEQPFMNFFKHFLDNTFKILDHQDIPMELIFSQLKIKYPIISVFFNMINLGATQQQTLTHFESHYMEKVQDAKFDIVFYISEYKNGIEINCHYLRNRFRPQSIEKLMDFYKKTLENICSEPGKKLKDYRFTTKKKKLKRHH